MNVPKRPLRTITRVLSAAAVVAVMVAATACARPYGRPPGRSVVIDTDGGIDDLMAIALLLSDPTVRLRGVTTVRGLLTARQAADRVRALLVRMARPDIPVFVGPDTALGSYARRSFPDSWMRTSAAVTERTLPRTDRATPPEGDAIAFLRTEIAGDADHPVFVALGPATNIALAIQGVSRRADTRILMMGGAVEVPGNLNADGVHVPNNAAAEWNVFIDPVATASVLQWFGHAELIPLDATANVPLDPCFVSALAAGPLSTAGQIVRDLLSGVPEWTASGTYYAWDPLAAMRLLDPEAVRFRDVRLRVRTEDPPSGQTYASNEGSLVSVAYAADRQAFATRVFTAFGREVPAGFDPYCKAATSKAP
jgi:purine nucleosidase